jgi:Zn-dependent peptidase ImmA (M78 family)
MQNNFPLQKAASDFRIRNGIGACEPIRMKSWLPKLGVLALFRSMSDNFSGMAIKHGVHRFIVINSNHRVSKQHFTIAHELYHLFVQEEFISER